MEDSYDCFIKFPGLTSNGLLLGNITQIAISEESMEEAGLEWNSALTAAVTMATEGTTTLNSSNCCSGNGFQILSVSQQHSSKLRVPGGSSQVAETRSRASTLIISPFIKKGSDSQEQRRMSTYFKTSRDLKLRNFISNLFAN